MATQSSNPNVVTVDDYADHAKQDWDCFVRASKNGTFLFCRDYMDYHRDRYIDASLMIRDCSRAIVALLPANEENGTVASHGGLTYGGFITGERMSAPLMLSVMASVTGHLRDRGFQRFVYKPVPHTYHRIPAEEDAYALFRVGARLFRRDVTTTVVPGTLRFQERRMRALKKAKAAGIVCGACDDLGALWRILEWNLRTVHNLSPVHTADEMRRLCVSFPAEIKLFGAFRGDELMAGTVIYETATVAHAQYTASSEAGRASGALDLLFAHLLTDVYATKRYFDFGVSTESAGRHLNSGLVEFKEGFGGRTVTHDFYELDL